MLAESYCSILLNCEITFFLAVQDKTLADTYTPGIVKCTEKKRRTCSELMKTGMSNVLLVTLFIVVGNIVQHCLA